MINVMRRAASYCEGKKALKAAKAMGIFPSLLDSQDFKCADCEGVATDYEHRDYNFPLAVVPVCHSCNVKRGPAVAVNEKENKKYNASLTKLYRCNRKEFDRRNNAALMAIKEIVDSWPRICK